MIYFRMEYLFVIFLYNIFVLPNDINITIMKTRYDKSKIMKLAHHMMKYEGFNKSDALKLAWAKAKRSEFYLIIEVRKPVGNFDFDMSGAANYYASKQSGAYTGD